jgi:uncharacterized protein YecE (DUF72 family)
MARAPGGTIVSSAGGWSGTGWDDASMGGTLYLGTSGFAYEEWRHGAFYPEGVTASRMLSHYAGVFRSVEINYTFRRFPTEATLKTWLRQTPPEFRFTLKANQRITHSRRLRDVGPVLAEFLTRARELGDRLGPILFQLPPNLEYDGDLLERFLALIPADVKAAMEFRHASWRAGWDMLSERGIARCIADTDEQPAAADELCWLPFGYLRLRRASYAEAELAEWAARIQAALDAGGDVYCYFKHEDSAAGPRMAIALEALLGGSEARTLRK